MNDRPLGCSVFYSTLLPYGFTLKLFTFSWAIEKCVSIFADKIDIQLKNLVIIDFYRQIKLVDWQLSTNIEYYRHIDYVFDDRLWSTCNVLHYAVQKSARVQTLSRSDMYVAVILCFHSTLRLKTWVEGTYMLNLVLPRFIDNREK